MSRADCIRHHREVDATSAETAIKVALIALSGVLIGSIVGALGAIFVAWLNGRNNKRNADQQIKRDMTRHRQTLMH